ncbi:hypothetical protein CK934_03380 [Chitinophaga sp. MD30]|nr:hypothetical protein CK934_03380 [Chitinophaga sp. MD30]
MSVKNLRVNYCQTTICKQRGKVKINFGRGQSEAVYNGERKGGGGRMVGYCFGKWERSKVKRGERGEKYMKAGRMNEKR